MSVRQFISEAYPEGARRAAWCDLLAALGLRSTLLPDGQILHASALLHGGAEGVVVARMSAGAQALTPLPQRPDLPLLLVPLEENAVLEAAGSRQPIAARDLVVLPRQDRWRITIQHDARVIALSVKTGAFRGRKLGTLDFGAARVLPAEGLAAVLSRALEAAAQALETLSAAEWTAIDQSLAELLLTLLRQQAPGTAEAGGTATQAALLHRICQMIERRLDEPDLSPARVAQSEGISERYLQKLFESTSDNFSHYLRERRLQRCWAELSNPAEAHRSVSEIAFQCGFNDAAHFSRAFRERFGLSPRTFRQQEAERLAALGGNHGQRGWPQEALVHLRAQRAESKSAAGKPTRYLDFGDDCGSAVTTARPRHHHLPVAADKVHWGFFSRSLKPLLEIASGDTITVETLTQHASDDPERMITGDPGAESVFHWTRDKKNVDRRGAGPMDASIYGAGPARDSASISAPVPSPFRTPNRATCWRSASSTWRHGRAAIRFSQGAPSAAVPRPGGAIIMPNSCTSRSRARP